MPKRNDAKPIANAKGLGYTKGALIAVADIEVDEDVVLHPLLGDAHLVLRDGEPITAMSAIDWQQPTQIPTIAEPRALPPGSGTLLVNEIALRAQRAQIPALRYAGPYPTPALFATLLRSFRTTATEAEFTADVLSRAMRLARDEVAVDFKPAPFERRTMPYGSIDVRDGIERATISKILFDRRPSVGSLARLVEGAAVLTFDGSEWTRIAELSPDGHLVDGPHAIPALTADILGKQFPAELKEVFADLVVQSGAIPEPLAADVQRVLTERPIRWRDLGWRAAAREDAGFALHAGWWIHLAPRGFPVVLTALANAIAPVAVQLVLDEVTRSG